MKYCKKTTESHPTALIHSGCIKKISSILVDEGHTDINPSFVDTETGLDLDCVEAKNASNEQRERSRSMDFTFGIANDDCSIQLMVLIELKLNHQNPNHVNRDKLIEKVQGSRAVLTNIIPIYANYIFIFQSDRKEEAKSRFFRMNPRIPNEFLVMDVSELHYTFF